MAVLVDMGHLCARLMYVSILSGKPKKVNGKFVTDQFKPLFYHLMFENLKYIKKNHKGHEAIICLDGYGSWRKDVYPDYKGNRVKDPNNDKDEINWEEWYACTNELITEIKENFPFKVIGVKKAEADDIIAVLAKNLSEKEEVIIYSEDKDFHQLIGKNIRQYRPISKKWINLTEEEVEKFKIEHTLIGDAVDNIPRIVDETEFTPTFLEFLRRNEIYEEDVYKFKQMTISKKLFEEFNVYKRFKSGKNKGKETEIKDIYKTVMFGEKALLKFMEDLDLNLKKNPLYIENYNRNKELILFDYIPSNIEEDILKEYSEVKSTVNGQKIIAFFNKYMLKEQAKDANIFFQGETESDIDFGW